MVMGAAGNPLAARRAGADVIMMGALSVQFGPNLVATRKWAETHNVKGADPYRKKLGALKGATVGITGPGGGSDQLIRYLAEDAGIDADRDLTIVTLGDAATQIAAFTAGRVDALSLAAPTSHLIWHKFDGVMLFNSGTGEIETLAGFLGSSLAVRGDWAKKNEATMVNFARGLQMGFDALFDPSRTEQARDAVRKMVFPDFDIALFDELWQDERKGAPKTGAISRQMVQNLLNFSNKFTKDKMPDSIIDGSFTSEYIEKAKAAK